MNNITDHHLDNNLKKAYEKIITDSINYVVCIDDEFAEPYAPAEESAVHLSKTMFEAFSDTCNCHIEMLRYHNGLTARKLDKYLSKKDLLILDWELSGSNELYALRILEQTIQKDIPFICIYTNRTNLEMIYETIAAYFSGYTNKMVQEQCEEWYKLNVEESSFKDDVEELFSDETPDTSHIVKKLKSLCGDALTECSLAYQSPESWYPLYLQWTNSLLPDSELPKAEKTSSGALNIDGKCILCFSKADRNPDSPQAIWAENIISSIADNITSIPNNKFDIVWLNYNNHIQKVIQNRTNFLHSISDKAFGYFSTALLADSCEEFEQFFKNMFRDEIMYRLNECQITLPQEIIRDLQNTYTSVKPNDIINDLLKLNEKISVNAFHAKTEHKLDFGDIFMTESLSPDLLCPDASKEFWLCITAKCDCFRPDKIEYNYIFIKGEKCKPETALKNAEKDYYSFINTGENYTAIKWNNKIQSILFDKDNHIIRNSRSKNTGIYKGGSREFTYICRLKETYTQRMANEAFAFGNRVGITYANLYTGKNK